MVDLYSDLNTATPTANTLVVDLYAINQSIQYILSTRKGERLFNLDFGVDIDDSLFDLMDELAVVQILDSVVSEIEAYEPRINVDYNKTTLIPDPDRNTLELILVFSVEGLSNQRFSVIKTFAGK